MVVVLREEGWGRVGGSRWGGTGGSEAGVGRVDQATQTAHESGQQAGCQPAGRDRTCARLAGRVLPAPLAAPTNSKTDVQLARHGEALPSQRHSPDSDDAIGGAQRGLAGRVAPQRRAVRQLDVADDDVGVPQAVDLGQRVMSRVCWGRVGGGRGQRRGSRFAPLVMPGGRAWRRHLL